MQQVIVAAGLALLLTTSAGAAPVRNSESIPPNCTLDPFTGKQVCHNWPTCTLDPVEAFPALTRRVQDLTN